MENPENPMYINLENPISFRKEILENAINVTTTLKNYEEMKRIRERKTKKLQELRGLLLDIKKTEKDFINSLPELPEEKQKSDEEPEKEVKVEKEKIVKKEFVKIEPPKIPVSREEDQLTREIMDIQKKLRNL